MIKYKEMLKNQELTKFLEAKNVDQNEADESNDH